MLATLFLSLAWETEPREGQCFSQGHTARRKEEPKFSQRDALCLYVGMGKAMSHGAWISPW